MRQPHVDIEWLVDAPESGRLHLEDLLCHIMKDHRMFANATCIIADDAHLQHLNAAYRNTDAPTDVLSFTLADTVHPEQPMLGDIYISIERARLQARQAGWPVTHEIAKLAVHGMLHLLGYDHNTDAEYDQMRALENRYLISAGVITEKGA